MECKVLMPAKVPPEVLLQMSDERNSLQSVYIKSALDRVRLLYSLVTAICCVELLPARLSDPGCLLQA